LTNKDSHNTQIIQCVNDTIFIKRFRVPGFGTGSGSLTGFLEPVPTSNHSSQSHHMEKTEADLKAQTKACISENDMITDT